jgi:hypothetical protein
MKKHSDMLSNTTMKSIKGGKYNVFHPEKSPPDSDKLYHKYKDGWRRK